MAITKIWHIKGPVIAPIKYITNPYKTGGGVLVSGINCSPDNAAREMNTIKEHFGKTDGYTAYHGVQSFAPGEVTPETAHEIGIKLAERLWGDKYQVLISTHTDTENHIHNHFVLNTVSFTDGEKYHRTNEDYRKMAAESDQLCYEYGISIIDSPERKAMDYSEWLAEKEERSTYRETIRRDIKEAMRCSLIEDEFFRYLKEKGYELKLYSADGRSLKRPSLKPYGAKRFCRFDSLGRGYQLEELLYRIACRPKRLAPVPESIIQQEKAYRTDHPPKMHLNGLAALYYHYCYELHIIQKFPGCTKIVTSDMREDLQKLEKYDAMTRFLVGHNIETMDDLASIQAEQAVQLEEKTALRDQLRKQLKTAERNNDSGLVDEIRCSITRLTVDLKKLRTDYNTCTDIRNRSESVKESLDILQGIKFPVKTRNDENSRSKNIKTYKRKEISR